MSDDELARRVARVNADRLRYVSAWGWQWYDGTRWRPDEIGRHLELVRATCEAVANNRHDDIDEARVRGEQIGQIPTVAVAEKVATVLRSRNTICSVEQLARSDPRLVAAPDDFDRAPDLLVTPGGTVDLRSGAIRANSPLDMITMSTSITPDRSQSCERFIAFLREVTADDADMLGYLRRFFGYVLTGSVLEHVLLFLFGTGGNGKSLLLGLLQRLLGDYAISASGSMLLAGGRDEHPTELARLRGKRLVIAQELDAHQRWQEGRLKSLTGGDRIAARLIARDYFEFSPSFKLIVAANEKPRLSSVGEAMRRRLRVVPFKTTIAEDRRDPELGNRIFDQEGPAVLAWLIDGAIEWRSRGLGAAQAIHTESAAYFDDEDQVSQWIDEACVRDAHADGDLADLYGSFRHYQEQRGIVRPSPARWLSAELINRGFEKIKHSRTRRVLFRGLRLSGSGDPPP